MAVKGRSGGCVAPFVLAVAKAVIPAWHKCGCTYVAKTVWAVRRVRFASHPRGFNVPFEPFLVCRAKTALGRQFCGNCAERIELPGAGMEAVFKVRFAVGPFLVPWRFGSLGGSTGDKCEVQGIPSLMEVSVLLREPTFEDGFLIVAQSSQSLVRFYPDGFADVVRER